MGCCGGSKRAPQATTVKAMSAMSRAGTPIEGMALIEYVGGNKGSSQWGGPGGSPSGQKYIFGDNSRDKIKYVRANDVAWILGLRDEGKTLFQVRNPKPIEAPEPVVTPEDEAETDPEVKAETEPETAEPMDNEPDIPDERPADAIELNDPADLTIAEIKALDLSEAGWLAMYEAEKAGKNRSGAIEFILSKLPSEDDTL